MMAAQMVDLNERLSTRTMERLGAVDFEVVERPVGYQGGFNGNGEHFETSPVYQRIDNRKALVRTDTGACLGIVSQGYKVMEHKTLIKPVLEVIQRGGYGEVPAGVYVDREGARMRALFKFQGMRQSFLGQNLCPAVKLMNTYDGTSRVMLEIGVFNFVCTNLAMGGGGAFLGGFMSVHTSRVEQEMISSAIQGMLKGFDRILNLFQVWSEQQFTAQHADEMLPQLVGKRVGQKMLETFCAGENVYQAYGRLTDWATHRTRSANRAFEALGQINRVFQEEWPLVGELQAA